MYTQIAREASNPGQANLQVLSSRYFGDWLNAERLNLAFTTYWLWIDGNVEELYDVAVLLGAASS